MPIRAAETFAACLAEPGAAALPLHCVTPAGLQAWLATQPAPAARFVEAAGFTARAQQVQLLPGPEGLAGAVLGLGAEAPTPWSYGALPNVLPPNTTWHLVDTAPAADAVLGWALGGYRYTRFRQRDRAPARLVLPAGTAEALATAEAVCLARELINTPANLLGPTELAEEVVALAGRHGARAELVNGAALAEGFPAIQAVGQGSDRPPAVAILEWSAPGVGPDAPLVALCGKGVCFDTGGLDLKPSSAMLRMKKDMGGAAIAMGLAELVMRLGLPVRLLLLVGAVENAVSARSFRPMDVIGTRAGVSVEIGNTDAEGRLVLADLLTLAGERKPALLLNFATLTGAARVALGPDMPALFSNDDALAEAVLASGRATADELWRLPLQVYYNSWLDSSVAETNNVASKPMAGAIVAALFLQRFVPAGTRWAHADVYAWNDSSRPGRPEGGEGQALRAMAGAMVGMFGAGPGLVR